MIASDEADCPQCAEMLAATTSANCTDATEPAAAERPSNAVNSSKGRQATSESQREGAATPPEQLAWDERLASLIVAMESIRGELDELVKKCRQATDQVGGNAAIDFRRRPFAYDPTGRTSSLGRPGRERFERSAPAFPRPVAIRTSRLLLRRTGDNHKPKRT